MCSLMVPELAPSPKAQGPVSKLPWPLAGQSLGATWVWVCVGGWPLGQPAPGWPGQRKGFGWAASRRQKAVSSHLPAPAVGPGAASAGRGKTVSDHPEACGLLATLLGARNRPGGGVSTRDAAKPRKAAPVPPSEHGCRAPASPCPCLPQAAGARASVWSLWQGPQHPGVGQGPPCTSESLQGSTPHLPVGCFHTPPRVGVGAVLEGGSVATPVLGRSRSRNQTDAAS